jgi:NAD(P)-dependent dehydrogenase (short-subunit alcohol dehydrogenase family)
MPQLTGETGSALLADRVSLVTGSGRGLGRIIAGHLARLGADLALHDLPQIIGVQR